VFEWTAIALLIDSASVLAAVSPSRAVDLTADAFERHRAGEWEMPPKVYVEAPPHGDFRAMPARGGGYAILKWVTSFPDNPARGLPVVTGALLLSDAGSGELLAILDCASITSLRTGAAAAVSARALARPGAASVGLIGCGVNGAWAARCLAAEGFRDGICSDIREDPARGLAAELGWAAGPREEAIACDVVVTVTPGNRPVIAEGDLSPGAHVAALGADAAGKSEVAAAELGRCRLFCDEWEQASGGGELSGPVERDEVERADVTELGAVLTGEASGRGNDSEITLFDSTGLAIQDLAIAIAAYDAAGAGDVPAEPIAV
jgi:ornithine cyclodeaminase/alanine dehydrogenase-like protein (mu-crystallin family)